MSADIYAPCPRCWHRVGPTDLTCAACRYTIPADYHRACVAAPPIAIAVIGFSGAGKTHVLAGVLLHLTLLSDYVADAIPFDVVGEVTADAVNEFYDAAAKGRPIGETHPRGDDIGRDIWIVTGDFPGVGRRTLIFYDIAGQLYAGGRGGGA